MGRSRGVTGTGNDDTDQRSKRRRAASIGETLESANTGTIEGKKASYHCNYCNKDISGKIRIKCTKCPDFDLCVECFSVGAEVAPHKSNHPYRVMDVLSFPLICSDWNADEEILLLEGIEMYGLGNWAEVAEHVGTKKKAQCIDHYSTTYINSPCYPLPDMSRVNGKNRNELLAMAKVQGEGKKGFSFGCVFPKEDSPFSSPRIKTEDVRGESSSGRSPSSLTAGGNKKPANIGQFKDSSNIARADMLPSPEGLSFDRSIGIKKPRYSGDEGPSMTELSGYNPKRQEFDPEYDNDAEQSLAEMEFKENDSETDRELKLRVLHIYLSRLNERKRRKDFILERNLLYSDTLERQFSNEELEVCQRYKVFMRFHSQQEHEDLLRSIIEERTIRRRILELQECHAAGCFTMSEAGMYIMKKRRREWEAKAQKAKENDSVNGAIKMPHKAGRPTNKPEAEESPRSTVDNNKVKGNSALETSGKDSCSMSVGQITRKPYDEWDLTGLPGTELLSDSEQQVCCESRLFPNHFLKIQNIILDEMFKGTINKKSDAHHLFKVESSKVDRIYDIVQKKLEQVDTAVI